MLTRRGFLGVLGALLVLRPQKPKKPDTLHYKGIPVVFSSQTEPNRIVYFQKDDFSGKLVRYVDA